MLYIDKTYVGDPGSSIPFSYGLPPGSHFIEIELGGYRTLGTWIVLEPKTRYTIRFNPGRVTGYLSLDVDPSDALLSVDGAPLMGGVSEQPVGKRRILAKRFGYMARSLEVDVRDGETSSASIVLEKAPFEIRNLSFSRRAFNPRNVGLAGKTSLDFAATDYGSARAEISGPDGEVVATLEYPSIEDWSQSRTWDGLDPDGKPLPDGVYTASLVATPRDGGEEVRAEAKVEIDSTIFIGAFGSASGIPGLLYMPDPAPESAGTIVTETFYFLPLGGSSGYPAFGLSGAMSIGGAATIALQASAETASGPVSSGDLAASVLVALFGDKSSAWSGAFFARGGYSSTASPSMPGAGSAIEAALPLAARLGELRGADLWIALAPGAQVDLSSAPEYLGLARAGLWVEGRSFRAGLSGELPFGFSGGFGPEWPARMALEGRLMLGSSPFVAAGYATADLSPKAGPLFGFGLGIGLLF
jgi:FlgD Ig-like domain